jgi:hypothetical protein
LNSPPGWTLCLHQHILHFWTFLQKMTRPAWKPSQVNLNAFVHLIYNSLTNWEVEQINTSMFVVAYTYSSTEHPSFHSTVTSSLLFDPLLNTTSTLQFNSQPIHPSIQLPNPLPPTLHRPPFPPLHPLPAILPLVSSPKLNTLEPTSIFTQHNEIQNPHLVTKPSTP